MSKRGGHEGDGAGKGNERNERSRSDDESRLSRCRALQGFGVGVGLAAVGCGSDGEASVAEGLIPVVDGRSDQARIADWLERAVELGAVRILGN